MCVCVCILTKLCSFRHLIQKTLRMAALIPSDNWTLRVLIQCLRTSSQNFLLAQTSTADQHSFIISHHYVRLYVKGRQFFWQNWRCKKPSHLHGNRSGTFSCLSCVGFLEVSFFRFMLRNSSVRLRWCLSDEWPCTKKNGTTNIFCVDLTARLRRQKA